ncbi:MAG TPA: hypothetical protein VHL53_12875 [Acidimicrobiia bacterium]|nr:hypothetical protein [Acidimicrobiia bacterium]
MTNRKHVHPALRPNPTVPVLTPADESTRVDALETWARRWGTEHELLLLASSRGEARSLNLLARSALRAAGRLSGPTVPAGHLELTPGDRVVAGPSGVGRPGGPGIPGGCPGDVRLVDPATGSAVIDFPTAGVVRLSRGSLQRASLAYGYAIPAPPGLGHRFGGVRLAAPAHVGAEIA